VLYANHETVESGLIVVKVGGSLLGWPELPARLDSFLDACRIRDPIAARKLVLLAGGGPAADMIRIIDRAHDLGDQCAHDLAIHALDLTARLLASIVPRNVVVDRPEAFRSIWNLEMLPILAPRRLLKEIDARRPDPLPASWNVTSDSIAARIAILLGASRLILLKSKGLPQGTGREEAARLGIVDPMFPRVSSDLAAVELVCLRSADPRPQLLEA
jgi:aspartokinase-like uncharacterized kinase